MTNTSKCAVSSPEAASRQTVQDLNHLANELRLDILDMVYKSKAGHIGGDFSVIEILTTATKNLDINRRGHLYPEVLLF